MYFCRRFFRGVAQLVARYVRDVEAASSSLVTPTILNVLFFNVYIFYSIKILYEHTKNLPFPLSIKNNYVSLPMY